MNYNWSLCGQWITRDQRGDSSVKGVTRTGIRVDVVGVPTESGSSMRYIDYDELVLLLDRRDVGLRLFFCYAESTSRQGTS